MSLYHGPPSRQTGGRRTGAPGGRTRNDRQECQWTIAESAPERSRNLSVSSRVEPTEPRDVQRSSLSLPHE